MDRVDAVCLASAAMKGRGSAISRSDRMGRDTCQELAVLPRSRGALALIPGMLQLIPGAFENKQIFKCE